MAIDVAAVVRSAALRRAARVVCFTLGVGMGVGVVCGVVALTTGAGLGECVAGALFGFK